ncbi:GumC family protein [Celeribacter litoreus]|uniref:GumC family protein n=1 Tax=Celeribacter litoreus TaxID=2876714 RepID=UPI001CCA59C1|nr:polysaccharide biosynthesis tyrosine autokinase [Celeribacter litoreus]MCA0044267.1 polysaccharide biosynthesis tyrosine autokinase [Celeribacter litoreus]
MNVPHKFPPVSSASSDEDIIDLSQLLGALWRNKFWIALVTVISIVLGGVYAYGVAVPKYRATSVVLLEASGQELIDLGAVLPSLGTNSEAINTEVEVLKSRRLLERVVNRENLLEDPEFNGTLNGPSLKTRVKSLILGDPPTYSEERMQALQLTSTINSLLERMVVRNVPNTYVLQITVESEGGAKSARLADAIAEEYILYQMDVKFEATRDASEWLSSRVADLKFDLEAAEARLASFSTSTNVISPQTVQALEVQLKELRDRLETTIEARDVALENATALATLQSLTPEEKAAQSGDSRLQTMLRTDGANAAFEERFALLLQNAAQQADRLNRQVDSISISIANLEADLASQSDELIQLQQLTRETEASRLLYEYFLGRLKETSAQEGIQQPDSRILSNAVLPQNASEPKRSLILAMAGILGIMIGSGGALLLEARQDNYRKAADLEGETGLPVMGQIPLLPTTDRRSGLEYLAEKPTSAAAEAIRNLRTSVLLSGLDKTPQVIMSTSSVPSEGKTTISFSLAQNLVGLGKKVLLVEGDIRRRVFSQYLDVKNANGLMSVLSKGVPLSEAVITDRTLGADILVSEASKVNAADILSSQSFSEFLEEARSLYDFIIIDTPPVLVVPDARVVAQHVDALLFTVRWDKTSRAQVRDSLRMFETVGVTVDGLVLNQIDPKGMKRYGYGEYYGGYGAYGAKYYTN